MAVATLALISQKGGVGRTTIAVNLSYSLVRRGWRVLLVDADFQGGVGFSLTEKAKDAPGFFDLLIPAEGEAAPSAETYVIPTKRPGLSLLTRGSRRALERILSDPQEMGRAQEELRAVVQQLVELDHDLVIFDAPGGVHPVAVSLARSVEALLVPQQPAPLCQRSLPLVLRMIASARAASGEEDRPRLAGFVLSMTDPEDPSNLADQREFRDLLPIEMVFETVIPTHRDFLEASRLGVPVAMLRERPSASSLIFDQLAAELETRLGLYDDDATPPRNRDDYARLVD